MAIKGWLKEQLEHSKRITDDWPQWRKDSVSPHKSTAYVGSYLATEAEHKVLANTLRELRLSKNNHY